MQTAALLPIGIFIFLIGVSVGVWYVWLFGAVCFLTAFVTAYKSMQDRRNAKRIAQEEAEIRAHQLGRIRAEGAGAQEM